MESVASNTTKAVISDGSNKDTFAEYKSNLRVCLSLYSKAVSEVVQGEVQPTSALGSTDIRHAE